MGEKSWGGSSRLLSVAFLSLPMHRMLLSFYPWSSISLQPLQQNVISWVSLPPSMYCISSLHVMRIIHVIHVIHGIHVIHVTYVIHVGHVVQCVLWEAQR